MKILELFAGTRSVGKAFERIGIERESIYSIEIDTSHRDIDWYADINNIQVGDIVNRFGIPDVVWASPPCQSYSVASIGHHRIKGRDGFLYPKTDFAKQSDILLEHTVKLIEGLKELNPKLIWFIENPMGAMRKSKVMQHLPRYTITYCQYGDSRMKPTDIWTNYKNPEFKPPCHYGDTCHEKSPRGSKTGTQGLNGAVERSRIPDDFCDHIAEICTRHDYECDNGRQCSLIGWCV